MFIVSVINYKGGVGKTTITANLAAELAWRDYKILLIDLDPQSSLTFSFIKPEEWKSDFEKKRTIKQWYEAFEEDNQLGLSDFIFSPQSANSKLKSGGR
ncbi:MAG: ParA family protein, partial [Thermodesulfobacteriota bacterium]